MRLPRLSTLLLGLGPAVLAVVVGTRALSASTPNTDIESYVLLATSLIRTTGVTVLAGNIGVNAGQLSVRRDLNAPKSQVSADTISFSPPTGACSVTQLFANHGTDGTTPCGAGTPFTPPVLGPGNSDVGRACGFPTITCPNPIPPAIDIAAGQTVVIPPGVYGNILVRGAIGQTGTLVFQGGDYTVCGILRATRRARMLFNNPTVVKLASDLRIGDKSFTGANGGAAVTAKDILFFSNGQRLSFRQRAEVHGIFCAPHARVHLDQKMLVEGRVVAQTIRVDRDVTIGPSGTIGEGGSSTTTTTSTSTTITTTSTAPTGVCGNGRIDGTEVCDPPDFGNASCPNGSATGAFLACRDTCRRIDYDGCGGLSTTSTSSSSSSTTSTSTSSTTSTSLPLAVCGNGVLEDGEACDPPDFGGATCAGTGALTCADQCTRIDTSTCVAPTEICGNCIDDDNNGLTDFEDPACCTQLRTFRMTLRRARILPGTSTSGLKVAAILARAGLAKVDPSTQDVFLQIRAPQSTDLLCAQVPPQAFVRKGRAFRFRDKLATVASARGITRMVVRIGGDGSVRFRARGKATRLTNAKQGPLQVTVGFRHASAGNAENRCSTVTQPFRIVHSGALLAP